MSSQTDSPEEPTAAQVAGPNELSLFNTIASALRQLDREAQLKMFRTLATFFEIPLFEAAKKESLTRPQMPSESISQPSFSEDRSLSPKQFVLAKKPQTDVERVTVLAYYLTHYRETPHFKTLDVSQLNTEAAQIKLSNPTAAVDNAATAGLLVTAGQGKKQISALGEIYVQALPDRGAARAAIADARPRRQRPKSKNQAAPSKPTKS